MKLIKAYVSSFGGLKDFEYNFNEKINTIKQDNGWGKTTFANFLKCMFYGINSNKRTIDENDRIKYKPWNSTEKFGGYLVFERGGKTFRIERFFGNKQSEDTVRLIDETTGKEYSDNDNLGERIFRINEEGFLSSTYLSQKELEATTNASLTAKFNEVCGVKDTELFDKAIKNLEDKKKVYVKTGNKGIISDLKEQIFAINEKLLNIEKIEDVVEDLKEKIATQEKQVKELENRAKDLSVKINEKKVAKSNENTFNNVSLMLKIHQDEIVKANEILCGKSIDSQQIQSAKKCIVDLRTYTNKKAELEIQKQNANKNQGNKYFAGLMALSVAFLGCAIATIFVTPILTAIFAILTFVSLSVGFVLKGKSNKNEQPVLDEITEYSNNCASLERGLNTFFGNFNLPTDCSYEEKLLLIESAYNSRTQAEKYKEEVEKTLANLNYNGIKSTENLEDLESQLESVEHFLKNSRNDLNTKIIALNGYKNELDAKIENESLKQEKEQEKTDAENELVIINKTLELLKQANNNLKTNMRAPLEQSLNKYLSLISGKEMIAKIDVDLNVFIEEKGAGRQAEYFSKGYKNVFEICKRFALTDVLFKEERPFIILDDPFYNLDDDKIKRSLDLLEKMSEEYQILYLVCHDSRVI